MSSLEYHRDRMSFVSSFLQPLRNYMDFWHSSFHRPRSLTSTLPIKDIGFKATEDKFTVRCDQGTSDSETFCSQCAGRMEQRIPPGDQRVRSVCTNCNAVAYENPKVVVGCVPISKDRKRVLLAKRAIAPVGKWTLPAGFLEIGETAEVGAAREAREEAGAELQMQPLTLIAVYNIIPAKQIQLLYRSTVLNEDSIQAGHESQEVKMFEWSNIPWENLAFPTVYWALDYSKETMHEANVLPQMRSR